MTQKLYTFCCRLCLHDGTVNQLLDIYSVKGLNEKLRKIFNIQVTTQESCTTNICLSCFQETLTLEQKMLQFHKHKQTIVNNQKQLQKSASGPEAGLSSAPLDEPQKVTNNPAEHISTPVKIRQTASNSKSNGKKQLDHSSNTSTETNVAKTNNPAEHINTPVKIRQTASNSRSNGKKQLDHSSNTSTETNVAKTTKHKCTSAKDNHNNTTSNPAAKLSPSKKKSSDKSPKCLTKNAESSSLNKQSEPTQSSKVETPKRIIIKIPKNIAVSRVGPSETIVNNGVLHKTADSIAPIVTETDKQKHTPRKPTGSNLEKQSASKYDSANAANGQNSAKQAELTQSSKVGTKKRLIIKKPQNNTVSRLGPSETLVSNAVPHKTADSIPPIVTDTRITVPNVPGRGGGIEQNIPVHVIGVQRTQDSNYLQQFLLNNTEVQPPITSKDPSQPKTAVSQPFAQSSPLPEVNSAPVAPLHGGLCSIPLANISTTVMNESLAESATSSNTLAAVNSQQVAAAPAVTSQLDRNRDSIINNTSSPGTITKRRHSTFIRVSSNLFNEPPEKAQFAMLNNNQFICNNETRTTNPPPMAPLTRLPVLPQGCRVQIVPNPETMMQFNRFHTGNQYPLLNNVGVVQESRDTASQSIDLAQPIVTHSNFGINYGPSFVPRIVSTSTPVVTTQAITTVYQPTFTGSASSQQDSVAPNIGNIGSNYAMLTTNSESSNRTTVIHSNHSLIAGISNKPPPFCFKCNLCISYYLFESSLTKHLRRVHQVEKNDLTCSKIVDAAICSALMSRIRRKSIADPSLLSSNNRS